MLSINGINTKHKEASSLGIFNKTKLIPLILTLISLIKMRQLKQIFLEKQ